MRTSTDSKRRWLAVALVLAAVLLAACGGAATPTASAVPTIEGYPGPGTPFPAQPTAAYPPPGAAYPLPSAPTAAVSGPVEALVAQATSDLAQRVGVDPASIQLIEANPQSWPDASLGCPQDGQIYAQVVTDGYRIVLEAGGQRYAFHTDRDKAVYCEQDKP
jgi:hypothetical protein